MITRELFERLFPTKGLTSPKNLRKYNLVRERDTLVSALNKFLPKYQINNHKRLCAFLGNCGIETDYFKTTIEYATGDDYEWRRNLGNTQKGDGRRFKGRGLTQTTGRYNYEAVQKAIGRALGIDVVRNPELLAEIDIAVESACIFWRDHNLNLYADRGEFKQLSGIVNRGDKNATPLHWAKRNELYSKCIRYMPKDFSFADATKPTDAAINQPNIATNAIAVVEPVITNNNSTFPASGEPVNDDSFLASAFDKNVSADEVKTVARSAAPTILMRFSRPFLLLYAMLEAGNVYAWLGVSIGVMGLILLIYLHRSDLKKVWNTIKNKFLQ